MNDDIRAKLIAALRDHKLEAESLDDGEIAIQVDPSVLVYQTLRVSRIVSAAGYTLATETAGTPGIRVLGSYAPNDDLAIVCLTVVA